jgi:signal transduction histidine kinase/CheY-like chemotaxis protein
LTISDTKPERTLYADRIAAVLAGGGEMGALMRAHDWSRSPLGPVERWPQSLRTVLNILLDSRYPMYVAWGPEFTQFYNDGYRPILGSTKHPAALGGSTRDTFAEIWDFIGPMFEQVMQSGQPTFLEDQILPMDRHGYVEECYFTFCYSAIRDDSGTVGGVFVTVTETTDRVLGERRLRTLRDLGAQATTAQDVPTTLAKAAVVLEQNPHDLPFALVYLVGDDGRARLAVRAGLDASHPLAVDSMNVDDGSAPWPLAQARHAQGLVVVDDIGRSASVLARPWDESMRSAAVVPLTRPSQDAAPEAFMVMGISPRLAFNDDYRGFASLVAGQLGSALSAASAYEAERRRAQALAELDRAKTTFFSNVSHEFRTPLTLMLGPLEDLLRQPADALAPANREKLALMQRNGLRLLKLVNTLLDFARIEAGRVQAAYEPVNLARMTEDLASTFRAAVERAGMRLVVDCRPLGEPVYVDAAMWEKVVLNLLSNAFKFTFEGEIRVTLAPAPDGKTARLVVADTGTGIPADELPRVFERFRRVEGARARTHEGSGIGLALVQELVRLHGGSIDVTSVVGEGARFQIDIPFGRAHLPAANIQATTSAASTSLGAAPFVEEAIRWLPDEIDAALPNAPAADADHLAPTPLADGAKWRVLVVDDNADMRAYLGRLLSASYEVDLATDGADALQRIALRKPDLVVSDVMMPRLDGFGLIRALRGSPETATMPIILLSARAGEESTLEGLASGADDYLVKPFSARELLARVRAHVEHLRALQQERGRLLALFDLSPSFIAVLRGPSHTFETANAAYLRLVGRSDIVGKPLLEALPELAGQGFDQLLDDVYERKEPHVGREAAVALAPVPGEPAQQAFVDFVYQPVLEPDGRVSAILVHGVDVTAQVNARRETESLYHSVKEANEAKRQFLTAMSHELRTPLNAVLGYTDLLALGVRGALNEDQLTDVERIRTASKYLLSLISDILNFSRVEAGQVDLAPTALPVQSVVAAARQMIESHIRSRGLDLDIQLDDPALSVYADAERLQQILLNLLMNASKFTAPGGRIGVRAEASGSDVLLHVEDTGVGIPEDQLDRIFDPFVQLDRKGGRESQQGVGLGLAISRDLARRMGGDLTVRSRPGDGSCFTVRLPGAAPA